MRPQGRRGSGGGAALRACAVGSAGGAEGGAVASAARMRGRPGRGCGDGVVGEAAVPAAGPDPSDERAAVPPELGGGQGKPRCSGPAAGSALWSAGEGAGLVPAPLREGSGG